VKFSQNKKGRERTEKGCDSKRVREYSLGSKLFKNWAHSPYKPIGREVSGKKRGLEEEGGSCLTPFKM